MTSKRKGVESPEWMDLHSLTEYADVSLRTLGDWVRDPADPLPASRVGGKTYVRKQDFDDYMKRHPLRPGIVDAILKDLA